MVIQEQPEIDFVFHIGARTDTTEFDYAIHQKLNVEYSQKDMELLHGSKNSTGLCIFCCNLWCW